MVVCPNCGEENPDRARVCMMCASSLGNAAARPQAEERKVVSILFVDLVGFTSRSHAADPEDVKAALGPYHSLLKREIERFGGTVEKFIGDAVMAVFGAPVAHEDDAERAVRAALRITETIAVLNESSALDLSVRAAVNTGEGLVALGARPEAGEGMVTGDVVNTASRLQNVAPVNEVVVGEITYRSTRDFIDYEELEPVTVKGKPQPVAVWHALSTRSRFGIDTQMTPKTVFIGREYEVDLLKNSFKRALRESNIQLVTVVGEPGVGKTRLLSEFSSFVDEQEELIFWRQGRSLPYGEGITFWALSEIIKAHAGILESDTSEEAAGKLNDAIASVVSEESDRQWFLARLGPLVGVQVSGPESPQKAESFAAWRRFLEAVAEERPLVLVFEDLHWADPALLEFIEHLVDWVTGVPMFVVCTARPELYDKHPNWGGGKRNINIVSLAPLSDSETAQLISSLLSQVVLPAEVHSALLDRAGGNPLYAEEFIRMLFDRGILKQKGRVLSLEKDAEIPVPESVHALIAARLDTLSSEHKSLLHDASVAGKVFWSGAIAAIGKREKDLVREGLHALGAKELVRASRTSSMAGEPEHSFWHALIRDVCYGQITRAARARKHKAMGAWIEAVAERLEDHAEVLAHHYSTALELAKASWAEDVAELEEQTRRFLLLAGDRAMSLDVSRAKAYYHRALELSPSPDTHRADVLAKLGEAQRLGGESQEAEPNLHQAIELFRSAGNDIAAAWATLKLAVAIANRGDVAAAIQLIRDAIVLLEPRGPSPLLALAYAYHAQALAIAGEVRQGLEWASKAISLAEPFGASDSLVEARRARGMALELLGDRAGIEDARDALRMALELGLGDQAALSYQDLGEAVAWEEGPAEELEVRSAHLDFAQQRGLTLHATWAKVGMAHALFALGRWQEAVSVADEVIEWAREHDDRKRLVEVLGMKVQDLVLKGEIEDAALISNEMLRLARGTGEPHVLAPALIAAAVIEQAGGNQDAAAGLMIEFARLTQDDPRFRVAFAAEAVRVLVACGELEQAQDFVGGLQPLTTGDINSVGTAQAVLAEAQGDLQDSLNLYEHAAQGWKEFGIVLEQARALLGAGRCLTALGRTYEASRALHQAEETFIELSAQPLIDETICCLKRTDVFARDLSDDGLSHLPGTS
jgi:class 3 adenylate cyclase/tetratricopeptide (TPR) repeat protein